MPLYETVLIARSDVTQQQVEGLAEQMAAQVAEQGGEIRKREYWGVRPLAYRIKKNRKGHYMLLGVDAPAPVQLEMERQLSLNEDVLRFLTIRVEAITEEPSAIIAKRSEEREARFRGPKPAGRFDSGRRRSPYDDGREEFRARSRDEIEGIEE